MMAGSKTFDPALIATNPMMQLASLIGDTDTTANRFLFWDEELQFYLDNEGGDLNAAAATAMRAAAGSHAKIAVAMSVIGGRFTVDRTRIADAFRQLAKEFDRKASEVSPQALTTLWEDGDTTWIDSISNRQAFDFEDSTQT